MNIKKINSMNGQFWVFQKLKKIVKFHERTKKDPIILKVDILFFQKNQKNKIK